MFLDDGRYNFRKKEEYDFHHKYDYMSGWLGEEEAKKALKEKKKIGTVELPAVAPPADPDLVETIVKTAGFVQKAQDPNAFEDMIKKKNEGDPKFRFMSMGGIGHNFYIFVRHCLQRKVDWKPLSDKVKQEECQKMQAEFAAKAKALGYQSGAATDTATGSTSKPPPPKARPNAPRVADQAADGSKAEDSLAFPIGTLVEVVALEKRPDMNGETATVVGYHDEKKAGNKESRYEIEFIAGRYGGVKVKLKPENLMYSMKNDRDLKKMKNMPQGELPNGTKVEIHGLQSETARWLNGQMGTIVQWDVSARRYEIRLDLNNHIKKIQPKNLKVQLPEGWEEHFDDHLQRHYYTNQKTGKTTWTHPTISNSEQKMGKVRETTEMDQEEADIDNQRQHYDCDEEDEGVGGFNLDDLINKVEAQESKRERGEDVDEFEYNPKKKSKIKKKDFTLEDMCKSVEKLKTDSLTRGRVTLLPNNMDIITCPIVAKSYILPHIQVMEMEIEKMEKGDVDAIEEKFKLALIEAIITGIDKICMVCKEIVCIRATLNALGRLCEKVPRMESLSEEEILDDAKWLHSLVQTF